ncbi:hypothetical protein KM043_015785 [Ampulex compressa]|nr:hypothetical protein KM043_015785 [Ampulex compressa]
MSSIRLVYQVLLCSFFIMWRTVQSTINCQIEGKFAIEDGTCKNYYICVPNGVGFDSISLTCKGTTVFDPTQETCVSSEDYICLTEASCVRYGRFEIKDVNCRMYYLCYWDKNGYSRMDLKCPSNLRFNPKSEKRERRNKFGPWNGWTEILLPMAQIFVHVCAYTIF